MMRRLKYLLFVPVAALMVISCGRTTKKVTPRIELSAPAISSEQQALIEFLEKGGDYINTKNAPYLLPNDDVYYNGSRYMLLDIRDMYDYLDGHVNGAVSVEPASLAEYLADHDAGAYDKVVIIDNTGMQAAYVASVLRAAGYNAYAMKEGMASWNKFFTHFWTDGLGNKYASVVTTKPAEKGPKGSLPAINTGAAFAGEIVAKRAEAVIADDPLVGIDEVMKNRNDYYIVNYWPKAKYDIAHLPGAVQYTPKKSMKRNADLLTLPTDKKIAVYCYTGQSAAALTGFLRLLGYDAYAIKFGTNSFMYNIAKSHGWHAYDAKSKVKNYPLVKGEEPSDKKVVVAAPAQKAGPAPVIKRKKKEAAGGGCD